MTRSTPPRRSTSPTTSWPTGACSRSSSAAPGKRTFNGTYDRTLNDNLTQGLARHAAATRCGCRSRSLGCALAQRASQAFHAEHDLVLTPTLARVTPELGWLNPAQPYETIIERLMEWVAFTPLQNATGDPAISLPMGISSTGLPIGVSSPDRSGTIGASSRWPSSSSRPGRSPGIHDA